jgi:uncharacterized delta-60 repeat protein
LGGNVQGAGSDQDFELLRCNPDGSLDTTFGNTGVVTLPIGPGQSPDSINALVLLPDGRIVAGGSAYGGCEIARLNSDGTLDTTFGTGGKTISFFGAGGSGITDMVRDSNGRFVFSASALLNPGQPTDFAVGRYDSNGFPDQSFGSNGVTISRFSTNEDYSTSIALQPNGKIIVAGYSELDFLVARYEADPSGPTPTATVTPTQPPTNTPTSTPTSSPTASATPRALR